MRRRTVISNSWPSWRYGPEGEAEIFECEEDVPLGWIRKPGDKLEPFIERPTSPVLDGDELIATLAKRGINIDPRWGHAHMKRIIDGDVSPTR